MPANDKDRADVKRVAQALTDYLNMLKQDPACCIVHGIFEHEDFQLTFAYDVRAFVDELFVDWQKTPQDTKVRALAKENCIDVDRLVCIEFREIAGTDRLQMKLYMLSPGLEAIFDRFTHVLNKSGQSYTLNIEMLDGQPQGIDQIREQMASIFKYLDLEYSSRDLDVGFYLLNSDCYMTYLNSMIANEQTVVETRPPVFI